MQYRICVSAAAAAVDKEQSLAVVRIHGWGRLTQRLETDRWSGATSKKSTNITSLKGYFFFPSSLSISIIIKRQVNFSSAGSRNSWRGYARLVKAL